MIPLPSSRGLPLVARVAEATPRPRRVAALVVLALVGVGAVVASASAATTPPASTTAAASDTTPASATTAPGGAATTPVASATAGQTASGSTSAGAGGTPSPATTAATTTGRSATCPRPTAVAQAPAAAPAGSAPSSAAPSPPTILYANPAVSVSAPDVTVRAIVAAGGKPGSVFVRFGESAGYLRCSGRIGLTAGLTRVTVSVPLTGLIARATYHFEVGASTVGGTVYGSPQTFTAPGPATIATGVTIGPIRVGGATTTQAVSLIDGFLRAHLGFTFEGVEWSAPRAALGAELDAATLAARALATKPGSRLRLALSVDIPRLRAYLEGVNARFAHPAASAYIRLVGTRAVVSPARPRVEVDLPRMISAVESALASGLSERLQLITDPLTPRKVPVSKAVVVRLESQTLTAYLNGKPVLTTPVTTGRPALPTPVGSYHVIFRASPYVFTSPWPPGSPYWYPPTPVTWAMEFYNGDFLHDDPGEPSDGFGAGSEDGPYASHGCVHIPHSVMAFLYNWLPVGAQVVVAQD